MSRAPGDCAPTEGRQLDVAAGREPAPTVARRLARQGVRPGDGPLAVWLNPFFAAGL
jgi:hypothetical protein